MSVRMPGGHYMDQYKVEFLETCAAAAQSAGHLWPEYAACEAAEESAFGTSKLARNANNLFGTKQHEKPIYDTLEIPTREFAKTFGHPEGAWMVVPARWVKYPGLRECLLDRMATLRRLATHYRDYAMALAAPDGEEFVRCVSRTWATDPHRSDKVIAIYREWKGSCGRQPTASLEGLVGEAQ